MKSKYFKLLLSGIIFPALLLPCRGGELRPDQAIATVNDQPISKYRYQELMDEKIKNGEADTRELRKRMINLAIYKEIVEQQALKEGFDKQEEVKQKISEASQAIF